MRQSTLFTKTRKEAPKDEVSKNAQLLIRAGYMNKEMAGVYSLLPLGLRVINKIADIIREEMNAIGGQEVDRFGETVPWSGAEPPNLRAKKFRRPQMRFPSVSLVSGPPVETVAQKDASVGGLHGGSEAVDFQPAEC